MLLNYTFVTHLWAGYVNIKAIFWEYTPVFYITYLSAHFDDDI
jgi:hypothetical protein